MDFCENLKGSVDIDSWTLAELTEVLPSQTRLFKSSLLAPRAAILLPFQPTPNHKLTLTGIKHSPNPFKKNSKR